MELNLKIGYAELIELIRQLPASKMFQLKFELEAGTLSESKTMKKADIKALLLKGPVMSEEQYAQFLETRNWMSQWRASH